MNDSGVAELADVILVALGLRVVALVLYPLRAGQRPKLLVLADDLPPADERQAFLAGRTPSGSLAAADIVLRTPEEFLSGPLEPDLGAGARILTDRRGIALARLRPI